MRAKEAFLQENIIAVVRARSLEQGKQQVQTLENVGIKIIEISLNNDFAEELIFWSLKEYPNLALGAATVLTVEQAKQVFDWGVDFMASPIYSPEVIEFAKSTNFFIIPGASTPSEISSIQTKHSLSLIKLFPAPSVYAFQGIQKVFPKINFVLSSFAIADIEAYVEAGAQYFAIGSYLTDDLEHLMQKVSSLRKQFPFSKVLST